MTQSRIVNHEIDKGDILKKNRVAFADYFVSYKIKHMCIKLFS